MHGVYKSTKSKKLIELASVKSRVATPKVITAPIIVSFDTSPNIKHAIIAALPSPIGTRMGSSSPAVGSKSEKYCSIYKTLDAITIPKVTRRKKSQKLFSTDSE